ncbi:MAG: hypothetical protein QM784_05130 [Polyangiaceae bacterium]
MTCADGTFVISNRRYTISARRGILLPPRSAPKTVIPDASGGGGVLGDVVLWAGSFRPRRLGISG